MNNDKVATAADIDVSIVTDFIAQQSIEAEQQFVFSYTITVKNNSSETVQLLSRYWLISDANGETNTVTGEGVIGQQPFIKPDQSFTYSSGCVLKSPLGNMQGHYHMQTHSAELIQVEIPPFRLAKPNILN
jgi:ApaG protein